jgi:UDP-glucose 4-epimerase
LAKAARRRLEAAKNIPGSLRPVRVLVTGGAGFIGSHIVDALVDRGDDVIVLDDLTTGFRHNVHTSARLIEGSIADETAAKSAVEGCELVFHQAAHKAVLRSVEQPLTTDTANTHGTLNILKAAADAGVRRVVHASSSSIYGGATTVPTPETEPLQPRSPYAVTKLAAEHYCRVFAELYGLETVALRYFNVYGPRQRPDATYAAVIPLFVDALLHDREVEVHGDGHQSRDFTYITDVIAANLAAAAAPAEACSGKAYNIAAGSSSSLLDLLHILGRVLDVVPRPHFVAPRAGDVRMSQADARAAARDLGFHCEVGIDDGLTRTVEWLRTLS